jgi:predicted DNA-binding protein
MAIARKAEKLTALAISRIDRDMGRKALDLTITTIRLDPEMMARIDARVGSRGRSQFLRRAAVKLLDELDEEDAAVAEALERVRSARAKAPKPKPE